MSILKRHHVNVIGRGKADMIFAHGYGCDQNMWRFLTSAFEDDYRVILYELVGSGSSDLRAYDFAKYDRLDGHARDLVELAAEVAAGPAVFVSHSVSAMIGLLAGVAAPERFAAHVMIGPSPCYINDGDYVGGFSRADIDSLLDTLDSNYLGWTAFGERSGASRRRRAPTRSSPTCSTSPRRGSAAGCTWPRARSICTSRAQRGLPHPRSPRAAHLRAHAPGRTPGQARLAERGAGSLHRSRDRPGARRARRAELDPRRRHHLRREAAARPRVGAAREPIIGPRRARAAPTRLLDAPALRPCPGVGRPPPARQIDPRGRTQRRPRDGRTPPYNRRFRFQTLAGTPRQKVET